jgi:hypothetical protein
VTLFAAGLIDLVLGVLFSLAYIKDTILAMKSP